MTPVEDLLGLPFLQPDQVKDSLRAYQLAKRGNALRVMAEAVRWGKRGAGWRLHHGQRLPDGRRCNGGILVWGIGPEAKLMGRSALLSQIIELQSHEPAADSGYYCINIQKLQNAAKKKCPHRNARLRIQTNRLPTDRPDR